MWAIKRRFAESISLPLRKTKQSWQISHRFRGGHITAMPIRSLSFDVLGGDIMLLKTGVQNV